MTFVCSKCFRSFLTPFSLGSHKGFCGRSRRVSTADEIVAGSGSFNLSQYTVDNQEDQAVYDQIIVEPVDFNLWEFSGENEEDLQVPRLLRHTSLEAMYDSVNVELADPNQKQDDEEEIEIENQMAFEQEMEDTEHYSAPYTK